MGVDVFGLVDLTDFIFRDGHALDFGEFMELVMQLRGSNQATVKDIVDLRKFIVNEIKSGMAGGASKLANPQMRFDDPTFGPRTSVLSAVDSQSGKVIKAGQGLSFDEPTSGSRSSLQAATDTAVRNRIKPGSAMSL